LRPIRRIARFGSRDVGGHAGRQRLVGVVDRDRDCVGRDPLGDDRARGDPEHLAVEALAGQGVEGDRGRLARREPGEVGLVDADVDPGRLRVDQGQDRHTGADLLADVGADRADDAVERREQGGVVELELGLLDL
jgi:hypothetical protein